MKAFGLKEILVMWVFFWLMGSFAASAKVVLIENNATVTSFSNVEADFAPSVDAPVKRGMLYLAQPLDACSTLTNDIVQESNNNKSPFVLISRGGCNFDDKVRRAQDAGFNAAIVYNNEDKDSFPLDGNSSAIKIHTVFVSRDSGKTLAKYANVSDMELWIVPNSETCCFLFFFTFGHSSSSWLLTCLQLVAYIFISSDCRMVRVCRKSMFSV